METLTELYQRLCTEPSDISEHLPLMACMARGKRVTEFGVRDGVSTVNFLYGGAKSLVSYDVNPCDISNHPAITSHNFSFFIADSLSVTIAGTDLLLIDSLHTFKQIRAELYLHQARVNDYIIMHDTVLFRNVDEHQSSGSQGLHLAITEFLSDNPQWFISEEFMNNNGLTVLSRI